MIDNIKAQLKDAMISKDKNRIIALRNFLGKLKAKEIEKPKINNEYTRQKYLAEKVCRKNKAIILTLGSKISESENLCAEGAGFFSGQQFT